MAGFTSGSDLVGEVEKTGLLPLKFQLAAITASELHEAATKERGLLHQQRSNFGDSEYLEAAWAKTLEEMQAGGIVWPDSAESGAL